MSLLLWTSSCSALRMPSGSVSPRLGLSLRDMVFWSLGLGEDLRESVKNVRKLVRKAKRDVVYVYSFSGVGARKSL